MSNIEIVSTSAGLRMLELTFIKRVCACLNYQCLN